MKGYVYLGEQLIKNVESITDIDYESKGDMIKYENLIQMIEDLVCEYVNKVSDLQEELDSEKEIRKTYYKEKSPKEMGWE